MRRIFSPLSLLLVLTFFLLFAGFFHSINAITQDLGRHLLTGKIILQTHTVPRNNLFSYTYPTFPFINTHWLSEVVFYVLQSSFGFSGLLSSMVAVVLLTFVLLFSHLRRYSGYSFVTACLILFPVLFERTDLRPELFSFFFLACFLVILYRYREASTRLVYLLPLLSLLWVNMHIYFLIGIAVVGLFLIEECLKNRQNLFSRHTLILGVILLCCCGTSLLNPNFLRGALYPFTVFQNYGYTIEENQNVFLLQSLFHEPTVLFFEVAIGLLFLGMMVNWRKTRLIDWFLVIFFTYLAASAIRNFPLFVIAAVIPLTISLYSIGQSLAKSLSPQKKKYASLFLFLGLLGLLVWQLQLTLSKHPLSSAVDTGGANAVTYFTTHHLKGPLFNNFDIGSYLEYRLYPRERMFVDGRPEAYPASFFQKVYIPMQQDPAVFAAVSQQYHFQTIIFSHTDQTPWGETFLGFITKDPTWKIVYLDDTMIILVPSNGQKGISDAPSLIAPYTASLPSLLQLAHFASVVSWPQTLTATLQAILTLEPHNCSALGGLSSLLQEKNDPTAFLYTGRYQQFCS